MNRPPGHSRLLGGLRRGSIRVPSGHRHGLGRTGGFTFARDCDLADARTFNRFGFGPTFVAVSRGGRGCFGDLNEDLMFDAADIGLLLSAWGSCGKAGPGCIAGLNEDGIVDDCDIGLILGA